MSESQSARKLMLIADQIMLKAANQVLSQTVRGFLESGFTVNLVLDGNTGHEAKNIASVEALFPEYLDQVSIVYYYTKFGFVFDWVRLIRDLLSGFKKNSDQNERALSFLESDEVGGFDRTRTGLTYISDLKYKLKWRSALEVARTQAIAFHPDIICGFEIGGAVPGEKLAAELKIPFFVKYMGTIVFPYIKDNKLAEVKPYVRGLSVNADLYLMLNDGTKGDEVLFHLGIPKSKVRFRIDGIDKDKFENPLSPRDAISKLKLNVSEENFVCLCLSNHNAGYKRLDRAIRAIAVASRENENIKLVLVGNGANTEDLKRLASLSKSSENIIFLPKVKHDDIPDLMSLASVYLNTNDQSNLSHPVLEAMMSGKAVVTMDDGSLDGIISNGENGILVDPSKTSEELPKALLDLSYNPERVERLGRAAKKFAQENFLTWDEKNRLEIDEVISVVMKKSSGARN